MDTQAVIHGGGGPSAKISASHGRTSSFKANFYRYTFGSTSSNPKYAFNEC